MHDFRHRGLAAEPGQPSYPPVVRIEGIIAANLPCELGGCTGGGSAVALTAGRRTEITHQAIPATRQVHVKTHDPGPDHS
jgi:hypothetical protein